MSTWISVKDKLPGQEEVIFVNGKNEVSVGRLLDYEECSNEKWDWASEDSVYFSDSIQCELCVCKYWMPLPEFNIE